MNSGATFALDRPKETLRWAEEALGELERLAAAFFQSRPHREVVEVDPATGFQTVKIRLVEPLPGDVNRRASEALQHTRHAFDQITFAIAKEPASQPIFPWAQTPKDLDGLLRKRGVPTELWDAFKRREPYFRGNGYAGGNDGLRHLAQLANNKHTIGLTVATQVDSVTTGEFSGKFSGAHDVRVVSPSWDPVKAEMVVAILPPGVASKGTHKITSQIVFDGSSPLEGIDVFLALPAFLRGAKTICEDIEAILAKRS